MEIPTKYDPSKTEDKWYKYWEENKFFHSEPDTREPFCIVIPPPNVTGVLHMGHMLNNTIQDVLVRRARMLGKNALWVPGTDHASIATEAKVVNKLKNDGISKYDIGRKKFLEHAWEWKEKHGGIILQQLRKLGASCDWDRTCFTMDESLSESVIKVFVDLYNKGKIYRGVRMVNWDPDAKTAVSDEEVYHKEVQSKLYYVNYPIEGEDDHVVIATTRPETILGDTAVCINPKDKRFKHLKGKKVIVPLVNRVVPIIEDEYVDMEFGTGCLKITPAHDENDYKIGEKHDLETIDIFNEDGTLSEAAELFVGTDRFEARKLVNDKLKQEGRLVKQENYTNKIGYSQRSHAVIEPRLSMQWFLKMKELAQPALENVMNDNIQLHPEHFKNTYRHWMENVRDWCISRQLWWGHRIPVYYLPNSKEYVVAENIDKALALAKEKTGNNNLTVKDLTQDEDVLDTWFSSWLWPISVFDGIRDPENKDFKYYYPTNDLVTGPDILFFWVARMIIAGYEYTGKKPFTNVYLTGMVRDVEGRKMSKSLGNSPDPLKLIANYGADGVRVGMLLCSPAGGDLLFDESLPKQGRNFGNKIWNAFRLVKNWKVDKKKAQPESSETVIKWFESKLMETRETIQMQFDSYRISEALMSFYRLFWDEFSSWYLETIKPPFGEAMDTKTYEATLMFFEILLQLLHPFMPFISEEIWQLIRERQKGESIMMTSLPPVQKYDNKILAQFEQTKSIITNIRKIRKEKNIAFKEPLELMIKVTENDYDKNFDSTISKATNLESIKRVDKKPEGAVSFIVKTQEYFIPLTKLINTDEELEKLQKDLEYQEGFLKSVMKKLNNERFVQNAPTKVVNMERTKKAEAEIKIKKLKELIKNLKKA